jgi:hypothetical protein
MSDHYDYNARMRQVFPPLTSRMSLAKPLTTPADTDAYENLLQDANDLIHGPRPADYSHPIEDFSVTADFWTTWGQSRGLLKPDQAYSPEDVAMMMSLMKVSRESRKHLRENILDGPGYVGCLGRVIAERMRRGLGAAYTVVKRSWWQTRGE